MKEYVVLNDLKIPFGIFTTKQKAIDYINEWSLLGIFGFDVIELNVDPDPYGEDN